MMRRLVGSHPITAYLVLAYALTWAYWVPLALTGDPVEPGVGRPTQLPGLLGPAVSALIVTAVIGGRSGLADMGRRVIRWHVGWWWVSVPAILVSGWLGLAFAGGFANGRDLALHNGISASLGPLATIALVFLVNGLGEEIGWRGMMADRLLHRHSLTTTALLVTLAWAPWHAPAFIVIRSFRVFSPAQTAGWALGLTAGSLVLTWLYRGSGRSILLVAVWHTAFNVTSATPAAEGAGAATASTVVVAAAVAIVIIDRRRRPNPARTGSEGG